MKSTLLNILLAFGLVALGGATVHAQGNGNPNPGILPPQAVFKGKTMSEWSVAWWQWVLGTEGSVQMYDTTGEFAYVNDNGADGVFFLAKTWSGVPQVRHVVVPPGTTLFVPVMGLGWWAPANHDRHPFKLWGSYEEFLEEYPLSDMHDLEIMINGKPVAALEDGNFHYLHYFGADGYEEGELPQIKVWWDDETPREGVGYEITLLLAPLPPGKHVIEMKGKSACCGGFVSDVTYHLTVLPGRSK